MVSVVVQPYTAMEDVWNGFGMGPRRSGRRWKNGERQTGSRHHMVVGELRGGRLVWLWNTKIGMLRDKLEPWWKGLGILLDQISRRFGISGDLLPLYRGSFGF